MNGLKVEKAEGRAALISPVEFAALFGGEVVLRPLLLHRRMTARTGVVALSTHVVAEPPAAGRGSNAGVPAPPPAAVLDRLGAAAVLSPAVAALVALAVHLLVPNGQVAAGRMDGAAAVVAAPLSGGAGGAAGRPAAAGGAGVGVAARAAGGARRRPHAPPSVGGERAVGAAPRLVPRRCGWRLRSWRPCGKWPWTSGRGTGATRRWRPAPSWPSAPGTSSRSSSTWMTLPYFPGPDAVLAALVEDRKLLLESTWHSLLLLLTGLRGRRDGGPRQRRADRLVHPRPLLGHADPAQSSARCRPPP